MKYDFSQEDANEMLERADQTNDELTHKIAVLNERIAALEAVAEATSYAVESHAVDVRCREGIAVVDALDKLNALKEAGRSHKGTR